MNQSSLSPELPVGPEPDRPRSAFLSTMVLLGVCSALVLTAPVLIRSLRVLLTARSPGSSLPSLLEVGLALLGVLALSSVVVGVITDLRIRLGGGRRGRRWRRHRRPWEEYLMESEAQEAQAAVQDFERMVRQKHTPETPVKNPRSMATLRLVEGTPWPLGSNQVFARAPEGREPTTVRNPRRLQPVTRLEFPVTARTESTVPRAPVWRSQEPAYYTPYPFSVWSYHDNLPDYYEEKTFEGTRTTWLWATLLFAGAALAAMFWWRAHGISMPFSV